MSLPFRKQLRFKLFALFFLISVVILTITNLIWLYFGRLQTIESASLEIRQASDLAAAQITNFLNTKEISLIIHSQTQAFQTGNVAEIERELVDFLLQDQDIDKLTVLDGSGNELVVVSHEGLKPKSELVNQADSLTFKVTTFVGGERYISGIYLQDGQQMIDMAIPIVRPNAIQNLQNLNSAGDGTVRRPGDISGVLIEQIHLSQLWDYLNTLQVGDNGYIYLVDDKGNVLSHPQLESLPRTNLQGTPQFETFIAAITSHRSEDPRVEQQLNEFGAPVLSTYEYIRSPNWGVITQIPISDINAQFTPIITFSTIVFLAALTLTVVMSLYMAYLIITPIQKLFQGIKHIASGHLDYRLQISSGDEIQKLGEAFNAMTIQLQTSFAQINQEKDKFSMIIASVKEGIIAIDQHQRVITYNHAAEKILGLPGEVVLGAELKDLIQLSVDDQIILPEAYLFSGAGDEQRQFRHTDLILKTSARSTPVNVISSQLPNEENQQIALIMTIHDLTDQAELEKMKLDFVAIAAHELRTPITVLRGNLAWLHKQTLPYSDQQRDFLNRSITTASNLNELVENLLSVSNIEKGTFSLKPSRFQIQEVLEDTIRLFGPLAESKQITIFYEPEPLPDLYADELRIRQVINNLMTNAIKYSTGGSVSVFVGIENAQLHIQVSDTGPGIPEAAQKHLFTKFYRVENQLNAKISGTGLGLYITRKIVESHGGKIWMHNNDDGGARFHILLPLATPDDSIYTQQG